MEHVLINIINSQDIIWKDATEQVLSAIEKNTTQFIQELIQLYQQTNENKLQDISLLILHKNILSNKEIFSKISQQSLELIINQIILKIKSTSNLTENSLIKSAEIITEISVKMGSLNSVLNLIITNIQIDNKQQIIFTLNTLQLMAEFGKHIKDFSSLQAQSLQIITQTINCTDAQTKALSTKAFGYIIRSISDQSLIKNYSEHIKICIDNLVQSIQQNQQENTIQIVQGLEQICKAKKSLLKDHLENILQIIGQIIQTESLEESLKIITVDFLTVFCESNKALLKNNQLFNSQILLILFQQMMKESNEDLEDDLKKMIEDNTEKKSLYGTLLVTMSNLGDTLSNAHLLQKIMPMCMEGLRSSSWQAQHISLVLIGLLAQGTRKTILKDLDGLLQLVLPFLQSQNPRVIYSSLTCLGLLLEEFSPDIQQRFGANILTGVLNIINQNDPKLICLNIRAVSCLINFTRELIKEDDEEIKTIIQPYTQNILQTVAKLFNIGVQLNNSKLIMELLDFISVISSLVQNDFKIYYQDFMCNLKALLKQLPQSNLTLEQIELKDKLIGTTSILLLSNKDSEELIQNDIKDLAEHVASLLKVINDDNALLKSSLNFFGTISALSKTQFGPYVNDVLQLCLKCLEQKVDYALVDQEEESKNHNYDNEKFKKIPIDLKIFGGKKVLSLNHSALEIQVATFQCLQKCLKQFQQDIPLETKKQFLEKISNQMNQIMPSEVKLNCLKIIRYLLHKIDSQDQQVFIYTLKDKLDKMLSVYFQTEETDEFLQVLYQFNKVIGVLVQSKQNQHDKEVILHMKTDWLEDLLNQILEQSQNYKAEVIEQLAEMGLQQERLIEDPEYYEDYNYYCTFDNRALTLIINLLKFNLSKVQQETLLSVANGHCIQALQQHVSSMEMHYAIGFYADLIEFCSEEIFNQYWQVLFSLCQAAIKHQHLLDHDLYQTIFFSLGNMIYRNSSIDTQSLNTFFTLTQNYLSKNVETNENHSVYDNIYAAYFKVMIIHSNKYDTQFQQNKYQEIIQRVPFSNDKEEALTIAKILLQSIQKQSPFLVQFQASIKQDFIMPYIQYLTKLNSKQIQHQELLKSLQNLL